MSKIYLQLINTQTNSKPISHKSIIYHHLHCETLRTTSASKPLKTTHATKYALSTPLHTYITPFACISLHSQQNLHALHPLSQCRANYLVNAFRHFPAIHPHKHKYTLTLPHECPHCKRQWTDKYLYVWMCVNTGVCAEFILMT